MDHNLIICPEARCQALNPRGANFCARCGSSLVPTRMVRRPARRVDWPLLGLSAMSFVAGLVLMRMGICFGFVFIGLPIASMLLGKRSHRGALS